MEEYLLTAQRNQLRARQIIEQFNLLKFWKDNGCRANIVGSLAMGLLVRHLDIDIHVYSKNLTEESSFALVSQLAKNERVKELRCINGLYTDERCIAWHIQLEDDVKDIWQIDIIHIEDGTRYDGYFERMAQRINELLTKHQRATILRLKYETPVGEEIHGVEYYQAVMEDGVETLADLRRWLSNYRSRQRGYWMP